MDLIEFHEKSAASCRRMADRYLRYLEFSHDADQRQWAREKAAAMIADAAADEKFATILRGRAVTV